MTLDDVLDDVLDETVRMTLDDVLDDVGWHWMALDDGLHDAFHGG